jgi:hypothetical protein
LKSEKEEEEEEEEDCQRKGLPKFTASAIL